MSHLAIAAVIVALLATGCNEVPVTHYTSPEQAASDHAFERGWLPDELRVGATNISEFHDLDSNRGGASFDYSPILVSTLEARCSKVAPTRPVKSRASFWQTLFAKHSTSGEFAVSGIKAYQCGSSIIELDTKSNSGVLWYPR